MLKKRKKALIALLATFSLLTLGIVIFLLGRNFLFSFHKEMMSLKPDTSEWILSNGKYTIVPTVNDYVTFKVVDTDNETVFECKEGWRSWDFKSLSIDENNNITANSSDTGIVTYSYKNGTWIEDD